MLVTHIYFNGECKQAIKLYKQAFGATVQTLMEDSDQSLVVHAEIMIHNELLMVNDFGNNDGFSKSGGYQLSVQFDDEAALKKAYTIIKEGSTTIEPLQPTDFSSCTVRFIDKFDVRWAFWV
ncbi:VOC family protein [Enterococcus sp. AZ072]|uniref:VOC family protein n=1 Tax=unclassified Enterococcus TaxID=2608891 RepID=UPI003D2E95D1